MKKVFLVFAFFTTTNEAILSDKTQEKLYTQFVGFVNFVFGMEEEKPIPEDVTFHLYTKFNPKRGTELVLNDYRSMHKSKFNPQLRTVFIIHGYTDHKERDIIVDLRKVLLGSFQINVIVVDWKRLAGLIYFNAASHACEVGKYLAKFLRFLETYTVNLSDIHLIGHSLGAQVAGIAGDILKGRIGRITGLDPAGPLFEFIFIRNSTETLDKRDAQFVDIIHTAADDFGITLPVGHVDFYPNNGIAPQPGCINIFTAVSCSHVRAVEFYIESINGTTPFVAKRCRYFKDGFPEQCNTNYLLPMGHFTSPRARGIFYLETNPGPPFARKNIH